MVEYLQIGLMSYLFAIGFQAILGLTFWLRKVQSVYPAFVRYTIWLGMGNGILLLIYCKENPWTYASWYWGYCLLDNILAAGALGELFQQRRYGYLLGVILSAALLPGGLHMWKLQLCAVLLAGAAWLAFVLKKGHRWIAVGFLIMFLFPAIIYDVHAPLAVKFVPTFAWIASQVIWCKEVARIRPSDAEQLRLVLPIRNRLVLAYGSVNSCHVPKKPHSGRNE